MQKYQSKAGYFGAVAIIVTTLILFYLRSTREIMLITHDHIFAMLAITFGCMLLGEYILKRRYNKNNNYRVTYSSLNNSNLYLLKSSLYRFLALFIPFVFFYLLIQNHQYFVRNNLFEPSRELADYFLYIFLALGFPYIFLTLKFRGDRHYEIGDYALLTLAGAKSLFKSLFFKTYTKKFHTNRRVKKIWLLYLVNFFFWTLMARFIVQEFRGFETEFFIIKSVMFEQKDWYTQFRHWYLISFHFLFIIDVSIALIGYSFASRWLNNRTKSVDATMSGWVVALLCYPPLNIGFTSQFISYGGLPTHEIITNPYILSTTLVLLFVLYSIYVWSTVILGFKFSNLTNRGIVSAGPYSVVRHPAYVSKNLSWWIDNTFVLSYAWATVAMALWNAIYITRALTEERHLSKDSEYKKYCEKVPYRFIPKVI